MMYYSTNGSGSANFREAVFQGLAPDGGLYMPGEIPQLPRKMIEALPSLSTDEIAYTLLLPYMMPHVPQDVLRKIVQETFSFPIPLLPLGENQYVLELFHGPTLAFKDVGARFLSRCLSYFLGSRREKTVVLVATSGDTGGAVASGFYQVPGIDVVILYPSGMVSRVQEQQLAALGENIHALEVSGSFDDCQRLVKQAFSDRSLREDVLLTSANSINIARWLPQQVYYFLAARQWPLARKAPWISVPSGNFGNLCAGILAWRSGLPVSGFIAACNANDAVPVYFSSGVYKPRPTRHTLSNAMDVGDPSNFSRMVHLMEGDDRKLRSLVRAVSISDSQTEETMRCLESKWNYLADPHGAVAFAALVQTLNDRHGSGGYFLETAHPVKFAPAVEEITGTKVTPPKSVAALLSAPKSSTPIMAQYEELREYLEQL